MIHFSERLKFNILFDEWCSKNNALSCPMNVIAFLQSNGLITEERFKHFLEDKSIEMVES